MWYLKISYAESDDYVVSSHDRDYVSAMYESVRGLVHDGSPIERIAEKMQPRMR